MLPVLRLTAHHDTKEYGILSIYFFAGIRQRHKSNTEGNERVVILGQTSYTNEGEKMFVCTENFFLKIRE